MILSSLYPLFPKSLSLFPMKKKFLISFLSSLRILPPAPNFKYYPTNQPTSPIYTSFLFTFFSSCTSLEFFFSFHIVMASSTKALSFNGEELHVLAVDDNVIDRKIVEKLLRSSSCKVTTAENGVRALEYLGQMGHAQQPALHEHNATSDLKVNLIITDYCMPEMTGYELLKKIKESSVLKDIPVVVMSSENIPTRIDKCLEEGAQMFMLKPLKHSDVKRLRCQLMQCRV